MTDSKMFIFMGMVHLFAAIVLIMGGSELPLVLSQFIGGIVEISIGLYIAAKSSI
jgi:hypothetical protein